MLFKALTISFGISFLLLLVQCQDSSSLDEMKKQSLAPLHLLDEDALKRPSQSRDLYRLLRTLRSEQPKQNSMKKHLQHQQQAQQQQYVESRLKSDLEEQLRNQRPYLVLPHKLARDKEFAAYDYIGPSDIELYPNGYFKMAAENSSD